MRYSSPGSSPLAQARRENQDENGNDNDNDDDGDDNFGEGSGAAFDGEQLFTMSFVKKFIHYAKNRFKPKLTDEVKESQKRNAVVVVVIIVSNNY